MADEQLVRPDEIAKPRVPMVMGARGFDFDFDSAWRFARGLIDGGMVPYGVKSPGAVVGLIEAGKELGLQPMYALANLTFTNGRLGIMGDAAKALIRRSGVLKAGTDFAEVYSGEEFTPTWKCTVSAHREGQPEPFSRSFSIADAITAKLVRLDGKRAQSKTRDGWGDQGPWSTYTARMLMYRALGFLVRDYFSDVLGGATLAEELRDYPQEPAVRVAPPSDPDPLLETAVRPSDDTVIDAEVVDDVAQDSKANEMAERATALETVIKSTNTIVGVEKVWKSAADLREALDPEALDRLTLAYESRLTDLGAK